MTDLTPITALGRMSPQSARHGRLTLAERPDLSLASLSFAKGSAVGAVLGVTLPSPGKWSGDDRLRAIWSAQNQWMIEAESSHDLAARLIADKPEAFVTDQTDGWAALDISSDSGPEPIHAAFEKLVNLDLTSFTPGDATRTGLEHMSVFVLRLAEDKARIWGMRSSFGSLWHGVETAARHLP